MRSWTSSKIYSRTSNPREADEEALRAEEIMADEETEVGVVAEVVAAEDGEGGAEYKQMEL